MNRIEHITKEFLVYLYDRSRNRHTGNHEAFLGVLPEQGEEQKYAVVNDLEPDDVATPLLLRGIEEVGLHPGPYWELDRATREDGHVEGVTYRVVFKRLDVFGTVDMWPSECPNCGTSCREFIDLRDEGHPGAVLMECVHDKEPRRGCGYRWIEEEGD